MRKPPGVPSEFFNIEKSGGYFLQLETNFFDSKEKTSYWRILKSENRIGQRTDGVAFNIIIIRNETHIKTKKDM